MKYKAGLEYSAKFSYLNTNCHHFIQIVIAHAVQVQTKTFFDLRDLAYLAVRSTKREIHLSYPCTNRYSQPPHAISSCLAAKYISCRLFSASTQGSSTWYSPSRSNPGHLRQNKAILHSKTKPGTLLGTWLHPISSQVQSLWTGSGPLSWIKSSSNVLTPKSL